MRVGVIGVYPIEAADPCHLLEMLIRDHTGPIHLTGFSQEIQGQPRMLWQVPWDERILNFDGTQDISGRFPTKIVADGTLRLAFFMHSLDLNQPLITPAGNVVLPTPEQQPGRLVFMRYERPD